MSLDPCYVDASLLTFLCITSSTCALPCLLVTASPVFVLRQLKELDDGTLGGSEGDTQIIWTSSKNAKKEAFNLDDIQHEHGWVGWNTG